MNLVVTTVYKPTESTKTLAAELAEKLAVPLVAREKCSLDTIRRNHQVTNVLVATKTGPVVHTSGGQYFFHINMAELRINNLIIGKHDHMIAALGITPGTTILDCTLGLGTDAIVASYATGDLGRVVGLETSPVIAAVTAFGLRCYDAAADIVTSSLRRIEVKNADYNEYLDTLPTASFDVVYFDPMFRVPIYSSSNLKPLRTLADSRALTPEAITKACRIAKRRVVVKEARGSKEFNRLGITTIIGGKYSSIHYGVLETGG
ncbi:MAG: hypothetical protein H6Q73_2866 [Firmicutes bacterium]|nr:hypothetical protein [Bacillota bacterium]